VVEQRVVRVTEGLCAASCARDGRCLSVVCMWLVPRIFDSRYLVCEPGQVAPIVFLEHSSGGLPDLAQLAHDVSADLPQQILVLCSAMQCVLRVPTYVACVLILITYGCGY